MNRNFILKYDVADAAVPYTHTHSASDTTFVHFNFDFNPANSLGNANFDE